MSTDAPTGGKSAPPAPPRVSLGVLAFGNFVVGMGAFVVVGILSPITAAFALDPVAAGWVMTAYAAAYALGSPLATALSGRLPRRTVLLAGMGLTTLGLLACALAPSVGFLYAARVATALGAGLVTPGSAAVAVAGAAPQARGKALAAVFGGLTAAQVVGVPAGSFVGYTFGWAAAFWITFALGLVAFAVFWRALPRGIAAEPVGLDALAAVLADRTALVAVAFTANFLGAIWIVFAFLGPIIEAKTGLGRQAVTALFVIYGVGAMLGNVVGGRGVDRFGPARTLLVVAVVQTALLPFITLLPWGFWSGAVLLFVWSLAGWAFMVPQQARLVALDPARAQVLLALNAAFIYVGAAIGPAIGGYVKAQYGLDALGIAAGFAGFLALAHLVVSGRLVASRMAAR